MYSKTRVEDKIKISLTEKSKHASIICDCRIDDRQEKQKLTRLVPALAYNLHLYSFISSTVSSHLTVKAS